MTKLPYEKTHRAKPGTITAWCGAPLSPVETVKLAGTPVENLTCASCYHEYVTNEAWVKHYAKLDAAMTFKHIGTMNAKQTLIFNPSSASNQAAGKLIYTPFVGDPITYYKSPAAHELEDYLFKKMFD